MGHGIMRKLFLIAVCLPVLLLLGGCGAAEQNGTPIQNDKTMICINDVNEADIWILPDTEANRKTTLWGTATASEIKKGESRELSLCEAGDEGLYLFRMIDTDGFFYSAGGITLEEGWTLQIEGDDLQTFSVEVTDENGDPKGFYEVFAARL